MKDTKIFCLSLECECVCRKHKRISLRIKNHAVSSVHPFSSSYFVPLTHFFSSSLYYYSIHLCTSTTKHASLSTILHILSCLSFLYYFILFPLFLGYQISRQGYHCKMM